MFRYSKVRLDPSNQYWNCHGLKMRKETMVLGTMRTFLIGIAGGIVLFCSYGCVNLTGGPRARWGYVPTPRDAPFLGPEELGHHSYGFGVGEGSGMVYTLRGGSIDLDHLRGTADIARYAYQRCYSSIRNKGDGFSFGPSFEWYSNKVQFAYPDHWDRLDPAEKETMAQEIALQVGAMVGFHSTLWHEMLTWYGTHFLLIEPEFYSAFSWDDTYSNALGNKLSHGSRTGQIEELQRSHDRSHQPGNAGIGNCVEQKGFGNSKIRQRDMVQARICDRGYSKKHGYRRGWVCKPCHNPWIHK